MNGRAYEPVGICSCHACTCPGCVECQPMPELPVPVGEWACPECGAPGGEPCDDTCPSGQALVAEAVETEFAEYDYWLGGAA